MNVITLDFETYFDNDYTLSKMTTEAYVRDPRFEIHGVGIRWPNGETQWYRELPQLDNVDAVLCHHAHFDGLILAHHYGIKPEMWLDTLSMARMLVGPHISASLDSLAAHFGLGTKSIPYELFKGKHWHELSPAIREQVASGCCGDVSLTWDLFCLLAKSFPSEEYQLVDATVRLFTEPVLGGNTALLGEICTQEAQNKANLLAELGIVQIIDHKTGKVKSELTKDWFFAKLLREEGVEPEQKPGKSRKCSVCSGTGINPVALAGHEHLNRVCPGCNGKKEIPQWNYSFAKTDDFMRDLLEHEDERVRMLAEARLAAKSSAIETRAERLGWMSTRGPLCVYLNYCGAHTTRWSGGDKVNFQNFKRGGPIAEAIEAPAGHCLVVNDASQIECRLLNEIAGQHDVIERFRNKEDPYVTIASHFYGKPITKADEAERGTGKQLELSCGYGAGGPTIVTTAKRGTYGPPVYLTDQEGIRARDLYRTTHPAVVTFWHHAEDVLKKLHGGLEFEWRSLLYVKDRRIWLPNGAPLIYETLEWHVSEDGEQYWRIRTRRFGWTKLYGAKLVENVIQALARLHVSQAWGRCARAGLRVVSMEHDKLIACVREHEAQDAYEYMRVEMSRPPEWLPNVPLDSEGYISRTFAKEK
jgi:DNA polymerase family A